MVSQGETGRCSACGTRSRPVAEFLSVCGPCLRRHGESLLPDILERHASLRRKFGLPPGAPRTPGGVVCRLCANACQIGPGELGLCGLRTVRAGRLDHLAGTPRGALVDWYDDPLPTNCVAAWVCEGSQQVGHVNLAVFYQACTFDCLFCQNWHFRLRRPPGRITAQRLAAQAHRRTFCACHFGGDPAAQMPHALAASRLLAERGVRICWETNGSMHPRLLDQALGLSLESGGCVKFDVKALDDVLHVALTGASNRRTLENLSRAARRSGERAVPPLVVVSTLLVPGYVDAEEVGRIAGFVAGLGRDIPYSLLAFCPAFAMPDLPPTSARHAEEAEAAARAAGLTRVHVGNRHLLSREY